MAKGSETWEGGSVPLFGESEILAQTAANDILTLTGASSQAGDFLVFANSTGAELGYFQGLSSSGNNGLVIQASATGAVAAGAEVGNAVLVKGSSKSNFNAAFAFQNDDSAVGTANSLLAIHGSKAPTYFLSIGGTVGGVGAETANGFLVLSVRMNSTLAVPDTSTIYHGLLCQSGSKTIYLLGAAASIVTVA